MNKQQTRPIINFFGLNQAKPVFLYLNFIDLNEYQFDNSITKYFDMS